MAEEILDPEAAAIVLAELNKLDAYHMDHHQGGDFASPQTPRSHGTLGEAGSPLIYCDLLDEGRPARKAGSQQQAGSAESSDLDD